MAKPSWGAIPAFVILLLTILASAFAIYLQSGYGPSERPSQQYEVSKYAVLANERKIVECTQGDIVARLKCENEIEIAYRVQHTSDRDLSAQQYMAIWAFLMAIASFGSVAVAWVGIVYIRRTLNHSVAATKAANEAVAVTGRIGEAQLRGYVFIKSHKVKVTPESLDFVLNITACGESPVRALQVDYIVRIAAAGMESIRSDYGKNNRTITLHRPVNVLPGTTQDIVRKIKLGDFENNDLVKIDFVIQANIIIQYFDIFGRTVFERQHWDGDSSADFFDMRFDYTSGVMIDERPSREWSGQVQ